MVIEEEWFDDMNFTNGDNFFTALINLQKLDSIKNKFPHDTKRRIWEITISNRCNTQIVQILYEKHVEIFIFKRKFLSRLPKPVEPPHEWIKKIFKYQEPEFYSRLFDDPENGPFEATPGHTKTHDKNALLDAPKLYVLR